MDSGAYAAAAAHRVAAACSAAWRIGSMRHLALKLSVEIVA